MQSELMMLVAPPWGEQISIQTVKKILDTNWITIALCECHNNNNNNNNNKNNNDYNNSNSNNNKRNVFKY